MDGVCFVSLCGKWVFIMLFCVIMWEVGIYYVVLPWTVKGYSLVMDVFLNIFSIHKHLHCLQELNIDPAEVENLLVSCILDK